MPVSYTLAGALGAMFVLGGAMELGAPPAVACVLSAGAALAAGRRGRR